LYERLAITRPADIPPMVCYDFSFFILNFVCLVFDGINLIDSELPIETTALLCSSIRKLYTHEEIKNDIAFDNRMDKIKKV